MRMPSGRRSGVYAIRNLLNLVPAVTELAKSPKVIGFAREVLGQGDSRRRHAIRGLAARPDVLVRDEAPGISGGDTLFDGLDKPPLVLEAAGEHLGSDLLRNGQRC